MCKRDIKTVLYVASTVSRTSATDQFLNVVRYLDKNVCQVHVLTLSPEPDNSRWKLFESAGVKISTLDMSRLQGLFFARRFLKRHIKRIKPDLIHTQGIRADCLVASLKLTVPHVVTVHSHLLDDYRYTYGQFLGKWMSVVQMWAYRHADLCVAVSPGVSQYLLARVPSLQVTTIPNGVDTVEYRPAEPGEKQALRQSLGLPEGNCIFVYSGNISELKDPLFLVDAWQQLQRETTLTLLLLGDGHLFKKCQQKALELPNVVLPGRVKNVAQYLKASDYLVSASNSEGYPVSVIEAMACGLPILLSDIPAHKDLINAGPSLGLCFKLGSLNGFLAALHKLMTWDWHQTSTRVRNYIQSSLSAEIMTHAYQKIYQELVQKSKNKE